MHTACWKVGLVRILYKRTECRLFNVACVMLHNLCTAVYYPCLPCWRIKAQQWQIFYEIHSKKWTQTALWFKQIKYLQLVTKSLTHFRIGHWIKTQKFWNSDKPSELCLIDWYRMQERLLDILFCYFCYFMAEVFTTHLV